MEYWDLYDYKGNKKDKIAIRGTKLNDDDFHLVVNAWIINDKVPIMDMKWIGKQIDFDELKPLEDGSKKIENFEIKINKLIMKKLELKLVD